MKKLFYFLCAIITMNFIACSNEDVIDTQNDYPDLTKLQEEIIIQERIDKGPVKLRLESH